MVLPLLKVVGGAIPHFRSAVGAIDHAGKQVALAHFRSAVTLLTDLLHLVKDFLLDDCRVGVVENRLFLNGRFPLLLVPDRVGVALEVDRTAGICQDTSKKLVRSLFTPEEPQQGLCPYASLPQDIFLT